MKHKGSVLIVFAILLLFLASFFIPGLKMESTENRTMATFGMIFNPDPESVVYHESPVERLDAALSDQFAFREFAVKRYLRLFNRAENLTSGLVKLFAKQNRTSDRSYSNAENQYTLSTIGSYEFIEDTGYLTAYPKTEAMDEAVVQKHTDLIEQLHAKYPGLKFYVYYVTQAYDTPWFDNYIGAKAADNYRQITEAVPGYVNCGHLVFRDLDDYIDLHYRTDHHWNHRGAQRGYENIHAMMSRDFDMGEARTPAFENTVSQTYDFSFLGSYGRNLGDLYEGENDEFSFYEYDFPERECAVVNPETLEETEVEEIGIYSAYRNGEINRKAGTDHYIQMYGTARDAEGQRYHDDSSLYVIRNTEGNGKNLLICADSYGRAVRDPLASHFDTTVYIDYRIVSSVPIDEIMERYHIDALLICSNRSMWGSDRYYFTFGRDE